MGNKLIAKWDHGKLTVSADFAEKPAAVMLRGDGIRTGIQLTTRATSYTVDFPADNRIHTVSCKPFPGIPGFTDEAEFYAGDSKPGYALEIESCTANGAKVKITKAEVADAPDSLRVKVYLMGNDNTYLWGMFPVPPDGGETEIQFDGAYGICISLHDADSEIEIGTPYIKFFE